MKLRNNNNFRNKVLRQAGGRHQTNSIITYVRRAAATQAGRYKRYGLRPRVWDSGRAIGVRPGALILNWGSGDSVLEVGQSVSFEFPAAGVPSEIFSASRGGGGAPPRTLPRGVWEVWKDTQRVRQPAGGSPKARVIPRNQHGVPPATSRQPIQNKTAPGNSVRGGGGRCT